MFHMKHYEERSSKVMGDKFLGVGLFNAVGIGVLAMLVSIFLKIIFTKYEVEGLSELIRTA